jgi:hypothetical protein
MAGKGALWPCALADRGVGSYSRAAKESPMVECGWSMYQIR